MSRAGASASAGLFIHGLLLQFSWAAPPATQAAQVSAGTAEAALVHIDCAKPRLDAKALFESLSLELGAQGINLRPLDAFKGDDNFVLEVRTDCETRQQLVLRAARGVQSVEETFSLADVPVSAEPRTVALALAELLEDFRRRRRSKDSGASDVAPELDAASTKASDASATMNNALGPTLDLGPEVDNAFREPPITIRDTPVEPEEDPGERLQASLGAEQRTFKLSDPLVGLAGGFGLDRAELGVSLLRGDFNTSTADTMNIILANVALGYRAAEVTNARWTASVVPRIGFGNLVATVERATDDPDSTGNPEPPAGEYQARSGGTSAEFYGDLAARISVNARLWSMLGLTLHSEAGYGRGFVSLKKGEPTHHYTGLFLGVALVASFEFSSRKAPRVWPPVSAKD